VERARFKDVLRMEDGETEDRMPEICIEVVFPERGLLEDLELLFFAVVVAREEFPGVE